MDEPIIRFSHLSMQFPGVLALNDLTLDVFPGEVFALVGENGAGKSTLMNILYGLHRQTSGELFIKGKKTRPDHAPKDAISQGVGMVHQHFMLVPGFTVAQNVCLNCEPKKYGLFYDFEAADQITRRLAADYGLRVDPSAFVKNLSVGQQQRVEILKTLQRGADILILDEPTAVLTPAETNELFDVIRRVVREKRMTVLLITHKLYEVMSVSDRVGVMRQGALAGVARTADVNERILASMMVGRDVLLGSLDRAHAPGDVAIRAQNLSVLSDRSLPAVKAINFAVKKGEILGVAAIEGNGQSELAEALTGMRDLSGGDAFIQGKSIRGLDPGEARALGLSHIPEDRLKTGISAKSSIWENLLLGKHRGRAFSRWGLHLKSGAIRAYARRVYEQFDIRAPDIFTPVGSLSGGNMQKVVVAREFNFTSDVLIISQPTRGVDIGAMEFIHQKMIEKRNQGCAILLISADLDEIFRLSDRIITLYEGRITGEFSPSQISKAEIGYYMTGQRTGTAEERP